jgi:hypothetical protein
MRRYGMPPARGGWVRAVAMLAVLGMVASLGYSALVAAQAPIAAVFVLVALLVGVPIWLLARRADRW